MIKLSSWVTTGVTVSLFFLMSLSAACVTETGRSVSDYVRDYCALSINDPTRQAVRQDLALLFSLTPGGGLLKLWLDNDVLCERVRVYGSLEAAVAAEEAVPDAQIHAP